MMHGSRPWGPYACAVPALLGDGPPITWQRPLRGSRLRKHAHTSDLYNLLASTTAGAGPSSYRPKHTTVTDMLPFAGTRPAVQR
jgi:hypothetical protein